MGLFRRKENRAEAVEFEDSLLKALIGDGKVNKSMALQIPTLSGGIDLIANTIASTPIKLYRDEGGKAIEITDDERLDLLNDDTGDTLNANEFWKAMIKDYFLGKGGYAYINKVRGNYKSLHYVDEERITIQKNTDPIFKNYKICVEGNSYHPHQFIKILRNTKDGMEGVPITRENETIIETAFESLIFEKNLVKRGGNKKGFLKAEKKLDSTVLNSLRNAFQRLYSNKTDNMVVLNSGIDFKECSSTSTEMQMNENKVTNAEEFAKLLHVSTDIISGKSTEKDAASLARLAAMPLMFTIQCALNRDLLLEKEKKDHYFAFDTKELLKGNMKERFDAYKVALDANFMQIDEVRYAEDLEPLGLNWVKLGLQDVLYDPDTKTVYTPNTNATNKIGENSLIPEAEEERANKNHDPKTGKFTSGGNSGKTTLDKEERKQYDKILLGKKTSDGIEIKSISKHAYDRAAQRNIKPNNILNSISNKAIPSDTDESCNFYQKNGYRVVVNKNTGNIVTLIDKYN